MHGFLGDEEAKVDGEESAEAGGLDLADGGVEFLLLEDVFAAGAEFREAVVALGGEFVEDGFGFLIGALAFLAEEGAVDDGAEAREVRRA